MAYWGGAGMNYVGGATADDRKEFLATYDDWLAANGRVARVPKGVYVPRAYVPKPKKDGTFRKALTAEQKAVRLLNLQKAREAKASGIVKPKKEVLNAVQKMKLRNAKKAIAPPRKQTANQKYRKLSQMIKAKALDMARYNMGAGRLMY